MIMDHIENALQYAPLGERLAAALRYLAETDFRELPAGRHDLRGDELYVLVNRYHTKPLDQGAWEAHRRYIDVQYMVAGAEQMGVARTGSLEVTDEYDGEKDMMLLEGEGDFITLRPGSFVVLMPQDAHMPGMALDEPAPVTKVVVKVLL